MRFFNIYLISMFLFFFGGLQAHESLSEILGSPHDPCYPPYSSLFSKISYCHKIISSNTLLQKYIQPFGTLHIFDNSLEFCDDITIFAKISKIYHWVSKISLLHPQRYKDILLEIEKVIGHDQDKKDQKTVSGYLNSLIQALSDSRTDFSTKIPELTGKTTDGIGNRNLIETLNSALYVLSTKDIIQNAQDLEIPNSLMNQLKNISESLENNQVENSLKIWGTIHQTNFDLYSTNFSNFYRILEILKQVSPFLEKEDIIAIYQIIGSFEDSLETRTLFGLLNKINHVCRNHPIDLEEQLAILLGNPQSFEKNNDSFSGILNTLYAPIHQKLLKRLQDPSIFSCKKLYEAIFNHSFFQKNIRNKNLFKKLGSKIENIQSDLQEDNFSPTFSSQEFFISFMNTWEILYKIYSSIQNLNSSFEKLIGNEYIPLESIESQTLSCLIEKLMRSFYLHPLLKKLGSPTSKPSQQGLTLFERAHAFGEQILITPQNSLKSKNNLKKPPYFGNYQLADLDIPDTLYRKIVLLQGALESGYTFINSREAQYFTNYIGSMDDKNTHTLFGMINTLQSSYNSQNISLCQQIILEAKDKIDSILFYIHKYIFPIYFNFIDHELTRTSLSFKKISQESGLNIALEKLNIQSLSQFFENASYTLMPKTVLDLYGFIGTISGRFIQISLLGNVLSLKKNIALQPSFILQYIGKEDDLKNPLYPLEKNTLYGNINGIRAQFENNKICSCFQTSLMLNNLSNEISAFTETLQSLSENIDEILVTNPSSHAVNSSLLFIQKILTQIHEQTNLIYTLKSTSKISQECQAFFINPYLQSLYNIFYHLTERTQKILPPQTFKNSSLKRHPLLIPGEIGEECKLFHQSLERVTNSLLELYETGQQFIKHLLEVKFFPLPSQTPDILSSYQESFKNIQNCCEKIMQYPSLCHHKINKNDPHPLPQISKCIGNFSTLLSSTENFNSLRGSYFSFQLASMTRLIKEIKSLISSIFINKNQNIDEFIRNKHIDPYIQTLLNTWKKFKDIIKNLTKMQPFLSLTENYQASFLEEPLKKITHILYSTLSVLCDFSQSEQHQNTPLPSPYAYEQDHLYRYSEIPINFKQMNEALQDLQSILVNDDKNILTLLCTLKNSSNLSYSPILIDAFLFFQNSFDDLKQNLLSFSFPLHSSYSNIQPPFSDIVLTLSKFTDIFKILAEELKNPRCCSPLLNILFKIKISVKNLTQLFNALIDLLSNTNIHKNIQNLQKQFSDIGLSLCRIAEAINQLSNKIIEISPYLSQKRCYSDELTHETSLILESISDLQNILQQILQQTPQPEIQPESKITASYELNEIANSLEQWDLKIHELVLLIKNQLNSVSFSSSQESNLEICFSQNLQLFNSFIIYNATPDLVLFFSNIASSLHKLSESLSFIVCQGKSICQTYTTHQLIPNLLRIAENITRIENSIQLLTNIFECIKSKNSAIKVTKILKSSSPSWLLGVDHEIFYRHIKNPKLFIKLITNPSSKTFNSSCFPFFEYKGEQVLWDACQTITSKDLAGQKIDDFSPISVIIPLQQMEKNLQEIQEKIQKFSRYFNVKEKLMLPSFQPKPS